MIALALLVVVLLIAVALVFSWNRSQVQRYRRERFIREFVFPKRMLDGLTKIHPQLSDKDLFLVARALRSFFLVHQKAIGRPVGMPSKAVDALWHEFILDTWAYSAFCNNAFGQFFHHIPASNMRPGVAAEEGLCRTWRLACLEENINPQNALRLPLLFALDMKLAIPGGNTYSLMAPPKPNNGDASGKNCGGFACQGGGLATEAADGAGCSGGSDGGDGGGGGGCGGN